jgi:sulfate permease, SulP family
MIFLFKKKRGNVKDDLLSGITVSLALVPEAVAFSFVAGVDPLIGLYSAFFIGLITSLFGGRPGMISGATGALAVVVVSLVATHGVEYLFATVVLMGILQIIAGLFKLGKFVRLIPFPVMLGFVNGLAIVIFLAQMGQFKKVGVDGTAGSQWLDGTQMAVMLGMVAMTMAIIHFLPKLTRIVPASLAAIVSMTVLSIFLPESFEIRTVFDQIKDMMPGVPLDQITLAGSLPQFHIAAVPFNIETLKIILPYSVILALVGLIESLMTLSLIDELTETRGKGNQECLAQGAGNIITGFFGGMGGCAMIGQSMINVRAGGRGRLSGFTASACLLLIVLVGAPLIEKIPLAALVGVMFMVVAGTFEWTSLKIFGKVPKSDALVMVLVSVVTVFTDLAIAVISGVIFSALVFAWNHAKSISVKVEKQDDESKTYSITGTLFFASVHNFQEYFVPSDEPKNVYLDFRNARVCDHSAVEAIHGLAVRYRQVGKELHLCHLSEDCSLILNKMGDLVEINIQEDPHYRIAVDDLEI